MCAFASYETQSVYDAFEGRSFETVFPKAMVSSVTELGNLVRDRASREKFDIMLNFGAIFMDPSPKYLKTVLLDSVLNTVKIWN